MSNVDSVETAESKAATFRTALRSVCMGAEESIDRSPGRAFFVLSIVYLVVVLILSSFKLLWLDELITLHIAKLGSASAVWHALARGADPNPPVTHLLVLLSRNVFGDHEFAYRLPAMVGYWVGLLSLFLYLKDRLPGTWALAGTVLSTTMAAFDYSYESRSYGIFYGLAMLAFLCWSRAVDPNRGTNARRLTLIGMVLALSAGISTNYFAILAFFPIAAGECALTIMQTREMLRRSRSGEYGSHISILRAIDPRIWIGLAVAGSTLLAYRSLIARSIAQFAPYAWNKVSLGEVADSYTEMVEIVLYPIVALFCFGIVVYFVTKRLTSFCSECRVEVIPRWLAPLFNRKHPRFPVPIHEGVGVLFFMLYPVLGYVVASIRGGMLSPRFVIPVCFGFAIAGTIVAFQLFGNVRQAGMVFLCFVSAWFTARESYVGYWYEEQKQCFYKVLDHLPEAELAASQEARIVIPDPLLVLTFQHYAPSAIASRVIFPVDFPAIRFFRHDDSPEENLWAGRNWLYTVPIVPVASLQKSASDYLIIASDENWFLDDLAHHHYRFDRLPINTRAGAIGGFTPLAHGVPTYFTAGRDDPQNYVLTDYATPIPFQVADNLPSAKHFVP
jgi:hypothetical protein